MSKEKKLLIDVDGMEIKYANNTIIQITSEDAAIGFGVFSFNEKIEDVLKVHTLMRMPKSHLKHLYNHIGKILNQIEADQK